MNSQPGLIPYLRLIRSQNVGPITFFKLLKLYKTAQNALDNLADMAQRGGSKKPIKITSIAAAKKEIEACTNFGAQMIAFNDPLYPKLLKQIADPPPIITVMGDLELLNKDSIAIVGARNSSINGNKIAQNLAKNLDKKNFVITSGLASGIDTSVHEGALEAGTIAVIAGGIDIIYPKENTKLYEQIRSQGLVIAECPIGTVPRAENFPRRNRIISGISLGTVVVEAASRSGSLITARFANEQNREVMAVPSTPIDPRSAGPNKLIRQGATLIRDSDDVIEAIEYNRNRIINNNDGGFLFEDEDSDYIAPPLSTTKEEELRNLIIEKIGYSSINVDDLVMECKVSINIVITILLELELAGRLTYHPGNKVSMIADL